MLSCITVRRNPHRRYANFPERQEIRIVRGESLRGCLHIALEGYIANLVIIGHVDSGSYSEYNDCVSFTRIPVYTCSKLVHKQKSP